MTQYQRCLSGYNAGGHPDHFSRHQTFDKLTGCSTQCPDMTIIRRSLEIAHINNVHSTRRLTDGWVKTQ